MKKGKIIMAAIAVLTIVGSASAFDANAKRAALCLYQRNGNISPFTRLVNSGLIGVTGHIRINNGACPAAVPLSFCNNTVNIQIEP